jgi:hypothetical protein
VFNFMWGLSAVAIVIAEGALFWPWSGVIIGILVVGGAVVVLTARLPVR